MKEEKRFTRYYLGVQQRKLLRTLAYEHIDWLNDISRYYDVLEVLSNDGYDDLDVGWLNELRGMYIMRKKSL